MSITYEKRNGELLLCYSPERSEGIDYVQYCMKHHNDLHIRNTFCVGKKAFREIIDSDDIEETFRFCIGKIGSEYIEIDNEVISTTHHFFFANDINIRTEFFVAPRNISILPKIDKLIDRDFYIGGKWEVYDGIPDALYKELVRKFPKTSELNHYCHLRISSILQDFFPKCDRYQEIYYKFIENQALNLPADKSNKRDYNQEIEYAQFSAALEELRQMLTQSETIKESVWQKKIHDILRLIHPKYILFAREIKFTGVDGYDKRPDFLLVDMNGFVDILEIKRPNVRLLSAQASYRNNYIPSRELSGAVQQIEKYILCLTTQEKSQKQIVDKLSKELPSRVVPLIVNPQGMLLLGRSVGLNQQQKRDLELIRRQYKNIVDIMTYDDLLARLQNIVSALEKECAHNPVKT